MFCPKKTEIIFQKNKCDILILFVVTALGGETLDFVQKNVVAVLDSYAADESSELVCLNNLFAQVDDASEFWFRVKVVGLIFLQQFARLVEEEEEEGGSTGQSKCKSMYAALNWSQKSPLGAFASVESDVNASFYDVSDFDDLDS